MSSMEEAWAERQRCWEELEASMLAEADRRDPAGSFRIALDALFDIDSETGEDVHWTARNAVSKIAAVLGATPQQIVAAGYPEKSAL